MGIIGGGEGSRLLWKDKRIQSLLSFEREKLLQSVNGYAHKPSFLPGSEIQVPLIWTNSCGTQVEAEVRTICLTFRAECRISPAQFPSLITHPCLLLLLHSLLGSLILYSGKTNHLDANVSEKSERVSIKDSSL